MQGQHPDYEPKIAAAGTLKQRELELQSLIDHHKWQIGILEEELAACHHKCNKTKDDWLEACIGDVLDERLAAKLDRAGYFQVKDLVAKKKHLAVLLRLTDREVGLIKDLFKRLKL